MNIAFITSRFLPEYSSGTEIYTYNIARGLQARGHNITVLAARSWTHGTVGDDYGIWFEDEVYEGMNVRRLAFNWRNAPDPAGYAYDYNPQLMPILSEFLLLHEIDLVHITSCVNLSSSVIEAAHGLNIPIVFTLTDYWIICPLTTLQRSDGSFCMGRQDGLACVYCMYGETKLHKALRHLPSMLLQNISNHSDIPPLILKRSGSLSLLSAVEKRNRRFETLFDVVDLFVSPSEFLKDTIVQSGLLSEDRIRISRHGHDISRATVGKFNTPRQHISFGYTGHLLRHKGVHILIKAFNQLCKEFGDDVRLLIYGDLESDAAYGQELQELAEANLAISFMGKFDNEDIGQILQRIDIVVVPSIWYENAPVTIAEAFAAKTPVIASNLGGMAEAINHNIDGLLFKYGNIADLVQQLKKIVRDRELLGRLQAGIKPVRTLENEAGVLEKLYFDLMSGVRKKSN